MEHRPKDKRDEIKIKTKDGYAKVKPHSETGEEIARMLNDIHDRGVPTNEDLENLGNQLRRIIIENEPASLKAKKIESSLYDVIGDIQELIREKNYDERLQEILTKIDTNAKLDEDELKEVNIHSLRIRILIRSMVPRLWHLSQRIIKDNDFRELLILLIDILRNNVDRAQYSQSKSNVSLTEGIKSEIRKPGSSNIPQLAKEKSKELTNYFDLTKEERRDLLNRLVSVIKSIREHKEYPSLINNILAINDEFMYIASVYQENPEVRSSYEHSRTALADVQLIVERLCDMSLRNWIDQMDTVYKTQKDPIFIKLRSDIELLIFDPHGSYKTDEEIKLKIKEMKNDINQLNNKYDHSFEKFWDETNNMLQGFKSDRYLAQLAEDWKELVKNTFTDESGKPSLTASLDSLSQLQQSFYPVIKEQLSINPLPALELHSESYIFKLDDFILDFSHLLPDQFNVKTSSNLTFDTHKHTRFGRSLFSFTLNSIDTVMKNVKFYYKSKTGLMYEDFGVINAAIQGTKVIINFYVEFKENELMEIFYDSCKARVDSLDIDVIESKHQFLDRIITTIFNPALKSRVNSLIEDTVSTVCLKTCKILNGAIRQGAKQAKEMESEAMRMKVEASRTTTKSH